MAKAKKAKASKKNRYPGKGKPKAKKLGKRALKDKRVAQAKKVQRYNKMAAKVGKTAAYEAVYGKKGRKGKAKKAGGKKGGKAKGKKGGGKRAGWVGYCTIGNCARRPILGGAKGMETHVRNSH